MPKRYRQLLVVLVLILGGGFWVWRAFRAYFTEPIPGRYDSSLNSTDLAADIRRMWETQPLRGSHDPTHGPNPRSSTDRAINAASRVFNTVELVGKTSD